MEKSLNTIIGNAKRFMAYEIIKRLEQRKEVVLLDQLHSGVKKSEKKKGQIHKVFEDSFDAKECYNEKFIIEKLQYIHSNPVTKKWNLANDCREYKYSSASFYENAVGEYNIVHFKDALSGKFPGSPQTQCLAGKTPRGQ
jgi:hypothetical protein